MITHLTIDRKVWLRGQPGRSYLLREFDQKRCCLGIYLNACGIEDKFLEGQGSPGNMLRMIPELNGRIPGWLVGTTRLDDDYGNSVDAVSLMEVNDDSGTPDTDRERFIIEKFAENGVTVEFVG